MKKILGIVVLGFLCLNTTFAADNIKPKKTPLKKLSKQLGNGELVKIQSYQAVNYKAIKEGWYKQTPIEVEALLTLPKGKGPFPVLILVHSSGGAKEFTKILNSKDVQNKLNSKEFLEKIKKEFETIKNR